jgi:hypothetical protein
MVVRDILDITNKRMSNVEKGLLITRMLKAKARRFNPTDTETPNGWNASPYPGSLTKGGGSSGTG